MTVELACIGRLISEAFMLQEVFKAGNLTVAALFACLYVLYGISSAQLRVEGAIASIASTVTDSAPFPAQRQF